MATICYWCGRQLNLRRYKDGNKYFDRMQCVEEYFVAKENTRRFNDERTAEVVVRR